MNECQASSRAQVGLRYALRTPGQKAMHATLNQKGIQMGAPLLLLHSCLGWFGGSF